MKMPSMIETRNRRAGFSLLEMLVVIGIIAFLASLLVVGTEHLRNKAVRRDTLMLIQRVEMGLEEYKADIGRWPRWIKDDPSQTDLGQVQKFLFEKDVVKPAEVAEVDGKEVVVDHWGIPLWVRRGVHNAPALDIWSGGPNETAGEVDDDDNGTVDDGTEADPALPEETDDIVNWTRTGKRE